MTYDYNASRPRTKRPVKNPDSMPAKPLSEKKQQPMPQIEFPKTKQVKPQGFSYIPEDPGDEISKEIMEQYKRDTADEFDLP